MTNNNQGKIRVITTVHGTYAKDATWAEQDSDLGNVLRERFGDEVIICPFRGWSGHNNVSARTKGKDKLIEHIRNLQEVHGEDAQYFVIAHSHGGNVGMYAWRDANLKYPLTGLACLATPFLVTSSRILPGSMNMLQHVSFSLILLYTALVLIIGKSVSIFPSNWQFEPVVYFAMVMLGIPLIKFIVRLWHNYAEQLLAELTLPKIPKQKLLIVRAAGDEASALLMFFQFLTLISVGIYKFLWLLRSLLGEAFLKLNGNKILASSVVVVSLIAYSIGFKYLSHLELTPFIKVTLVFVFMYAFVAFPIFSLLGKSSYALAPIELLIGIALFPLVFILSILLLPFGWQISLGNVFLDVTAESTPPGSSHVDLLDPNHRQNINYNSPSLLHSVHSDPQTHELIRDWISGMGEYKKPRPQKQRA